MDERSARKKHHDSVCHHQLTPKRQTQRKETILEQVKQRAFLHGWLSFVVWRRDGAYLGRPTVGNPPILCLPATAACSVGLYIA